MKGNLPWLGLNPRQIVRPKWMHKVKSYKDIWHKERQYELELNQVAGGEPRSSNTGKALIIQNEGRSSIHGPKLKRESFLIKRATVFFLKNLTIYDSA